MPKLYHQYDRGIPIGAIPIGRRSPWDNPFRLAYRGDQDTVIEEHARWLAGHPDLLRALDDLRGRDLVCSCGEQPCHGDLLLRLAALSQAERLAWAAGMAG